ncbi:PLP-dependent transferase [Athelia psychrophila]|uniref:PLP-dependent transferase n=1 Tax=Athelia psychrophila TaxID=1759441 RepID=A0A166E2B2_9AGAM|nr:PLP-dependent transferase [Fibularhizoctonia sp. CBS 109695]
MTTTITQTPVLVCPATNAPEILISSNATNLVVPANFAARGSSIPPNVPHAICGSLPTWKDTLGLMTREPSMVEAMKNGYPRFFIHRSILKLSEICEQHLGVTGEGSLVFPSLNAAKLCQEFMIVQSTIKGSPLSVRLAQISITRDGYLITADNVSRTSSDSAPVNLHITLYPADASPLAKDFWRECGMGISSRMAQYSLSLLSKKAIDALDIEPNHLETSWQVDDPCFNSAQGKIAKCAIRSRISELLRHGRPATSTDVNLDDVFLYPTGMCAIWNAHNVTSKARPTAKSVCFGFSHVSTIHLLKKNSPGCHFFASGSSDDMDILESIIMEELAATPSHSGVFALFTEIPSNPLLRSPDLPRLRALADKCNIPIVLDETIGNFMNVDVLSYADILVTSLSKLFSGAGNVMGGSLVVNPAGRYYQTLKQQLHASFQDTYFDEDAICMEHNSRDFASRASVIDRNAEAVCELIRSRSMMVGVPSSAIKEVHYPKWTMREQYDHCRTKLNGEYVGGFGGLCSVIFTNAPACRAFYDALDFWKGPSLGTNFTLAMAYALMSHYDELEWAAKYGVTVNLVRISVGMEGRDEMLQRVAFALTAAEEASDCSVL